MSLVNQGVAAFDDLELEEAADLWRSTTKRRATT